MLLVFLRRVFLPLLVQLGCRLSCSTGIAGVNWTITRVVSARGFFVEVLGLGGLYGREREYSERATVARVYPEIAGLYPVFEKFLHAMR